MFRENIGLLRRHYDYIPVSWFYGVPSFLSKWPQLSRTIFEERVPRVLAARAPQVALLRASDPYLRLLHALK